MAFALYVLTSPYTSNHISSKDMAGLGDGPAKNEWHPPLLPPDDGGQMGPPAMDDPSSTTTSDQVCGQPCSVPLKKTVDGWSADYSGKTLCTDNRCGCNANVDAALKTRIDPYGTTTVPTASVDGDCVVGGHITDTVSEATFQRYLKRRYGSSSGGSGFGSTSLGSLAAAILGHR